MPAASAARFRASIWRRSRWNAVHSPIRTLGTLVEAEIAATLVERTTTATADDGLDGGAHARQACRPLNHTHE